MAWYAQQRKTLRVRMCTCAALMQCLSTMRGVPGRCVTPTSADSCLFYERRASHGIRPLGGECFVGWELSIPLVFATLLFVEMYPDNEWCA